MISKLYKVGTSGFWWRILSKFVSDRQLRSAFFLFRDIQIPITNILLRWRFDGVPVFLVFTILPISKQWSLCDRSLDGIAPTLRSQETQIQAFASDDLDLYTLACFSRSPFVFLRHSLRHYLHQDQGFKYIEGKNKNNTELIRFFHEWNKELFVAISLLSFVLVINMERKWTLLLN